MPFLALLKSVEATETFDYYSRCSGELNFNKKANESNLTSLILDVSHPHQTVDTNWNAGGSLSTRQHFCAVWVPGHWHRQFRLLIELLSLETF